MTQDESVNVTVKVSADNSGADKAEKAVKRVGSAAKKTAAESKSGFEQMSASVGKVSGAFGKLRAALTGFGIGAVVTAITGGLTKIIGSFGAAQKSAAEFAAIQQKLAEEKGIAKLSNDYAALSDAINAAAAAENHQLEMIDIEVANRRKLAAAKLESAKEDEISKLDANAKDYAERLDKVEKKYAALKAAQTASNAKEDIVLARQKMEAQAAQTDKQAEAQDAASKAIEAKIAQTRRAKSVAEVESIELNDNDKTDALSIVGKTLGQLFTGDWGRMNEAKTAEGDAVRKAAAEQAAQLDQQLQALTEELRKSNAKAESLRQSAQDTRAKAGAMSGALEAAEIEGETARRTAARGESAAQTALDKNHEQQAKEAATLEDAKKARTLLHRQKSELEANIEAEREKKAAAGLTVHQAQNAYDLAAAGGNRGAQTSALANLQAVQAEAQNVDFAADKAINALTETLKSVETRLKAAQSYLENHTKQQRNAWSEAPAG